MSFRDPSREEMYQTLKEENLKKKVSSAYSTINNRFNIINHNGPPRKLDQKLNDRNEMKKSIRDYNILTNLRHKDHEMASAIYNEEYILQKSKRDFKWTKNFKGISRNFDILSNEFINEPEKMKKEEYESLKKHVLKKYWETHDYDPIRGKYYDPIKEKKFRSQREMIKSIHGVSTKLNLPPSIKFSEGKMYNIINHNEVADNFNSADEQEMKTSITTMNKSTKGFKTKETENRIRENGIRVRDLSESRKMNKISFKRWESEIDRGYDLIKNEVIKKPNLPIPKRPQTMWAKLSMGENDRSNLLQNPFDSDEILYRNVSSSRSMEKPRNLSFGDEYENTYAPNPQASFSERSSISKIDDQMSSSRIINSERNKVPSLDLSKTNYGENVSYKEPSEAVPKGLPVKMIRTGGFSGFE